MSISYFEERLGENKFRNQSEFEVYLQKIFEKRKEYEKELADNCRKDSKGVLEVPGYCENCGKQVKFQLDFLYSYGETPNFRERMVCPLCGLNNRQRAVIARLMEEKPSADIYMYEQVTAVYKAASKKFENLIGSEYISPDANSGEVVNGILHEDAENLSFKDQSFDLILSCDVFEHVVNYKKCFAEAFRVLKPNGKLYMTLPFYTNKQQTEQRAAIKDGNLVYLKEPLYHGNPISEEGSLVFWDYGWDLLELIRQIGFKDVYLSTFYSKEKCYLGVAPFCIIAEKAGKVRCQREKNTNLLMRFLKKIK